jgi:hypothetical protein
MKRTIYLALLISAVAAMVMLGASDLKGHADEKGDANGKDLTVPEAWRGTWEVTVTYRDRETGATVATDVTTAAICPGEPIMPRLLDTSLHFSGAAASNNIGVSCRAKHSPLPGCNVFVDAGLESQRDGDTWSGTGNWTAKIVGNCEHLNFGEDFIVTGRRLSREAACGGERASLVQRFFAHTALVFVLEGEEIP